MKKKLLVGAFALVMMLATPTAVFANGLDVSANWHGLPTPCPGGPSGWRIIDIRPLP